MKSQDKPQYVRNEIHLNKQHNVLHVIKIMLIHTIEMMNGTHTNADPNLSLKIQCSKYYYNNLFKFYYKYL